jgi:hypothetical protein
MKYQIEKNIPIPPEVRPGVLATAMCLGVGDSFLVPNGNKQRISSSLTKARAKGLYFKYAQVSGGIRVWRTE